MKPSATSSEPTLASNWPISRIEGCLNAKDGGSLISFLEQRYEERFLGPIRVLRSAPQQYRGYGFAIMALCSLLVESLQCYRYGLPTTHGAEYGALAGFSSPPEYAIKPKERRNGRQVFEDFFALSQNQALFPGVDGATFYLAIRNGLLHQAQTKEGWRIRRKEAQLWNPTERILDRDRFFVALEHAFKTYLDELKQAGWDDDIWRKARRKIWWLIRLSS